MKEKPEVMNSQEKEFQVFGFINNKLRAGMLIGLLSLSLTANIYTVNKIFSIQQDLYEKMLDRVDKQVDKRVDTKLDQPLQKLNSAVDAVVSSSQTVDSTSKQLNIRK